MPRLEKALPKLGRHKDQACVYLGGRRIYLGKFGTKDAQQNYDRAVAEWLASGRSAPRRTHETTVNEVLLAYLRHAKQYYRKDGKTTNEVVEIKAALQHVKALYGSALAESFGPLALECVRDRMIEYGWARTHINKQVSRVVRAFKWAASRQLAPGEVVEGLRTLDGLKKGRTTARETDPVQPVDDATVEATLPELSGIVADMVKLQRLLGCRPGELCDMRPCDIDRGEEAWVYTPPGHKTEHFCRHRRVFIGPSAQGILMKYLLRPADSYCFDPRELPGARRNAREKYTKDSYGRSVRRAAKRAGVETWSPNRLRHTRATEIRREFGLEAAQVVLGHASADVTQVYAERNHELARNIAIRTG